jgi:hypothetical protein
VEDEGLPSTTSSRSMRRYISALPTPLCGWRPTSQANSASAVLTGVPSPQRASGRIVKVSATPVVPSGRGSLTRRPFSKVGSSVQSMQTRLQDWS